MKKRCLALFLSLTMLLGVVPTTAFAYVGDLLQNGSAKNQSILEGLPGINSKEAAQAFLEQYGLLDKNGELNVSQTLRLDGKEMTLGEVTALLERSGTDLSKIAEVDGVPIALGDLKTILQIEKELQRIKSTYFSGKAFEGESLNNLNSLMSQIQSEGIGLAAPQGAAAETWIVNMADAKTSYDNYIYFAAPPMQKGQNISVRFRINEGLLSDYITGINAYICSDTNTNACTVLATGALQSDGSYLLEYAPPKDYTFGTLAVKIENNRNKPAYTYGDILAAFSFYDAKGMAFQNGSVRSGSYNYFYTANQPVPGFETEMTYGGGKTHTASDATYDYLGLTNNGELIGSDLPKLCSTAKTAQDARRHAGAADFYQPYEVSANLTASWTGGAARVDPWLPYSYGSSQSPLHMTDIGNYFFNGTALTGSLTSTKSGAGIEPQKTWENSRPDYGNNKPGTHKGTPFTLKILSDTKNWSNETYILPYRLYSDSIGFEGDVTTTVNSGALRLVDSEGELVGPTVTFSVPAGTYTTGMLIPITLRFPEIVKVGANAELTINGNICTAADLHMNAAGTTLMAWYPVPEADTTTLLISKIAGITDLYGKPVGDVNETIPSVVIKSALLENAPTAFDASYADGKASFTFAAKQNAAYKTKYTNYDATPSEPTKKLAPFQVALYKDGGATPAATLPIYLKDSGGANIDFAVEDYPIAPTGAEQSFRAELQSNDETKASPTWQPLPIWQKNFTVAKKVSVDSVAVAAEADAKNYTLSVSETYRPTLSAAVAPTDALYKTGAWSSSAADIAAIDAVTGVVTLTGSKVGKVTFSFTADNGTAADTSDDKVGTSAVYTVVAGDSLALVIPDVSSTIFARQNAAATVLWSSNAGLFAPDAKFDFTIDLFTGNFADDAALTAQTPVATYTAAKDKNSQLIPADVLGALSAGDTPAYTVRVSMPHPTAPQLRLSALAHIVVQPKPAAAKLTPPANLYLTDAAASVDIPWELAGFVEGSAPAATLVVKKISDDNTATEVYSGALSGAKGSYTLPISKVASANLKDTYQVTLTVQNAGEESPSVDAFPLYVYQSGAMKLAVDGRDVTEVTLDNASKVSGTLPTDTAEIMALREQLGLMEFIGINYDKYKWSSFKDGIKWITDHDEIVSVNYKQGGLYENIKNFSFESYLPETLMGLSSYVDGTATVTATHANTGMTASALVTSKTLRDKFCLFRFSPAQVTTLRYTDGKGAEKTAKTNADGVLALYEPEGIASDIYLSSGTDKDAYLGTFYKADLRSGERDATKLQLYPLNSYELRPAAKAELTLAKPDGSPLANANVTLRGGVYKNDGYCEIAQFGANVNDLKDGKTDISFTTDAAGKLTVLMDSTQFWSAENKETDETVLTAEDSLRYVFEVSGIDGDAYYPLFITVNGSLGLNDVMRTGQGVINLEALSGDEKGKPFVAAQSVDYGLKSKQEVDVRRATGRIGPNSTYKTAHLRTTMFLWGEKTSDVTGYDLCVADEFGFVPEGQTIVLDAYPFSSIPVAETILTLSEASMTTSGWIPNGEDRGLKTVLTKNGTLVQEKALAFRAIDLTRVPKVTEDERVTQMLVTMKNDSSNKKATSTLGDVGDSNILKLLNGKLEDMTGPVDSSVFKMIISPSEDSTVFRAMIWAGYSTLDMEDMDYSSDGVALSADLLKQDLSVSVPGVGDLNDMAGGTYNPKQTAKDNAAKDSISSVDVNVQLEGYYEAEIRYNMKKDSWEIFTIGGGFTTGVGVGFAYSINTWAGPVPFTATFELGGGVQFSFKTAVRYSQQGAGLEWTNPSETAVNDYLNNLRLNAYVHAFGGIGFDYAVVALKIGIFGNLDVDSQNKFLSRDYLTDPTKRQINGQALGIKSEIGLKFVASVIGIKYEAILASGTIGSTKTFNSWRDIDDYWSSATSGLGRMGVPAMASMAAQNGLSLVSSSATLESRDYLDAYARTWGQTRARKGLRSLDESNKLANLQTNANPSSYPAVTEDGKLLAYMDDGGSASAYESRVKYSTLAGDSYAAPIAIPDPAAFEGFGDSGVALSGSENFAAAAWVRMGTNLPGKNPGDTVTPEEQNLLMNGSEIVASIYNGSAWTSTRLTENATPDMAPAVAVSGDKVTVFWRSVYSAAPGDAVLSFTTRDCIMYRQYTAGTWGEEKMLYNGGSGAVKALETAMLPDGTAIAVYTLDRSAAGDTATYEIAYSTVSAAGAIGTTMIATNDTSLDENPQVVAAHFGDADDRFVMGWHSTKNDASDIRLLAVDAQGSMSNRFPESLNAITANGDASIGGSFHFASLNPAHNAPNDITIVWDEMVNDDSSMPNHSILKAAKLRYVSPSDKSLVLSAPLELAALPENTVLDHFDAYVSAENQVKAVIQAAERTGEFTHVGDVITFPSEQTKLFTATTDFVTKAAALENLNVDYAKLSCNSLTPISFTLRNTGLDNLQNAKITLGTGETAALAKELLPNESATLIVWHRVGDTVADVPYTLTANGITDQTGTVYLDYPDLGISKMETIREAAGKRTVRMTLYNSAAATLAGGKDREVKLAFYTDDQYEKNAVVTSTTAGVTVDTTSAMPTVPAKTTFTIAGEQNLKQIDEGVFTLELTYDLGSFVKNTLHKDEIPETGMYLFADAWTEGKIGAQTTNERLPEYLSKDNKSSVLLTGALSRTGEPTTLSVEQGTAGGKTTAKVLLRNNSLQDRTGDTLLAVLQDADGSVLETKSTAIGGTLSGETEQTENIAFTKQGSKVKLIAAGAAADVLTFDGLPVSRTDFTGTGSALTYDLGKTTVSATLVTAISGSGADISINGQKFTGNGSLNVPISGKTTITVVLGANTYTLKLEGDVPPTPPTPETPDSGSGGGTPLSRYPITKGAKSTWTQGMNAPLVFTCDAALEKFTGLEIDKKAVSKTNYTAASGSTVITLSPAYLATLTPGTHTLRMLFRDGSSEATFTIDPWVNPFADVKVSDWFYGNVNYVSVNGLMTGTEKTAFSPKSDTTRAMIWSVLYRMAGSPGKTEAPATWYSDAQAWAIAEKVSDGTDPDGNVTREQLAAILYRYAKAAAVTADMSSFTDTADISDFAADGISWAVASKILQGSGGKLNPQGNATRAEIAAMLQRFASLSK